MIVTLREIPFALVITGDDARGLRVLVPALPGCYAFGDTSEEALENA